MTCRSLLNCSRWLKSNDNMTTFGWKRKLGQQISKSATSNFQEVTGQQNSDSSDEEEILMVAKQQKLGLLEDASSKSKRLKEEGAILAEAERYWEAIKKWDEALQLTPENEHILDMKAQALLILHEVFPAVQSAEDAVKYNPRWWVGYQTLGRAQLGLGDVKLAVVSFSKALHLNPAEAELWTEDLSWARSLLKNKLGITGESAVTEEDRSNDDPENDHGQSSEKQTFSDRNETGENLDCLDEDLNLSESNDSDTDKKR
ncbi:tetratricopeptide repeat protein 33-like [Asterias rubens]|uniref:tetratricopeptide repeat protein 33-like n=1 Tax=Asterias rubens TaxID=7604 RepID=UPI0014553817|nr:tetratricopeptide repeat protein 33-like [Asterias rubens]